MRPADRLHVKAAPNLPLVGLARSTQDTTNQYFHRPPPAGAGLMCMWNKAQVGVERVIVSGRVRVLLRPLMDTLPIIGAVQVHPFCPTLFETCYECDMLPTSAYQPNLGALLCCSESACHTAARPM